MVHRLLQQVTFWTALLSLDQELAAKARQAGCSCGGVLHRADFLRKPRGGPPDLPPEYCYRFSFCCNREGCRKRVTPPSLWFLDRKVYLHAVIILVAALRQGPTPRRVRERSRPFCARGGGMRQVGYLSVAGLGLFARLRVSGIVQRDTACPYVAKRSDRNI